jgi:DNA-binding MarR family transcriptional regulator
MTEAGLVARKRDPEDRRHVTARITARGLRLLDEVQPGLEVIERRRTRPLDAGEIQDLLRLLDQVRSGT